MAPHVSGVGKEEQWPPAQTGVGGRGDSAAPAGCPHLSQPGGVGGPGTALQLQRESL